MSDRFISEIKEQLSDLPEYYLDLVDENYKKYVEYRYSQGQSMSRIENGFGNAQDIAKRYRFFYELHQVQGRRRLKGGRSLIKRALKKRVLASSYYGSNMSKFYFKGALMFVIGLLSAIWGLMFFVGNLDNPWGMNMLVISLSVAFFAGGIACLYYISMMYHKVINDFLSKAMDGCKLDYFGQ